MKYEFGGRVRYSEIDENGRLLINGLVNYFQDVAMAQAEHLGIGSDYLKQRSAAWVLMSWQIVIDHLPKLYREVTAQTWPYEFKQFYGMRNFTLLDEEGKMAAWANSVWVLYDLDGGRPLRVFPELLEKYGLDQKLEMDYAPRKIVLPEGGQVQESFLIGKHHLDTNHHVNNGQYIIMAAEHLPADFEVHQMRVEYRMQAKLGDMVTPVVVEEGSRVTVGLCDVQQKPYAIVEFETHQAFQIRNCLGP